jgi:hypothetical protein
VKQTLMHLPLEILQQIITYLAPCQKMQEDDKDRIRKQAHKYVLELLCILSSLRTIGMHYLWAYRVAAVDYDEGNDIGRSMCRRHNEFKFCPDTPPGERSTLS